MEMIFLWSFRADSNRRPARYECAALPTEPRKHIDFLVLFSLFMHWSGGFRLLFAERKRMLGMVAVMVSAFVASAISFAGFPFTGAFHFFHSSHSPRQQKHKYNSSDTL